MNINLSHNNPKILVLMSGGVDSAVAAALMVEKGFQVTGLTMKIWSGEYLPRVGKHHGCYGPEESEDIEDACRVAELLHIPFNVIDLSQEYKDTILDHFCREYLSGRTPNPCIRCNHRIKFQALIDKARASGLDFDLIASGHYARVEYDRTTSRYSLKKARDLSKDQSYFLSFLSQEQLGHLIFPLGEFTKADVRQIAARFTLPVAGKPDSQNFISGDYSEVVRMKPNPGPVLDGEGHILGQHMGIHNYTIGQRKGLNISSPEPLYVVSIDPSQNTIRVGDKAELFAGDFTVSELNWVSIPGLVETLEVHTRIRHSHPGALSTLIPVNKNSVQVIFKEPQMSITPGQAAVFYREDTVIGGGLISACGAFSRL